jgi:formamidase
LQNRWHPDVPFCGTIKNGETVKIECLDWTGGQIKNNDSADDVKNVDLTQVHYLSGPFEIEDAEPGDVLLIEIQDVRMLRCYYSSRHIPTTRTCSNLSLKRPPNSC